MYIHYTILFIFTQVLLVPNQHTEEFSTYYLMDGWFDRNFMGNKNRIASNKATIRISGKALALYSDSVEVLMTGSQTLISLLLVSLKEFISFFFFLFISFIIWQIVVTGFLILYFFFSFTPNSQVERWLFEKKRNQNSMVTLTLYA